MKLLFFSLLLFLAGPVALCQTYTISGYIQDASSSESLIGAHVLNLKTR